MRTAAAVLFGLADGRLPANLVPDDGALLGWRVHGEGVAQLPSPLNLMFSLLSAQEGGLSADGIVAAFDEALLTAGRGGIAPDLFAHVGLSFAQPRGEWESFLAELKCFDEVELTGSIWESDGT